MDKPKTPQEILENPAGWLAKAADGKAADGALYRQRSELCLRIRRAGAEATERDRLMLAHLDWQLDRIEMASGGAQTAKLVQGEADRLRSVADDIHDLVRSFGGGASVDPIIRDLDAGGGL